MIEHASKDPAQHKNYCFASFKDAERRVSLSVVSCIYCSSHQELVDFVPASAVC